MQSLEVSGAVRPLYGSLGAKGLTNSTIFTRDNTNPCDREQKGELHWKYLQHASNAIDTKVTELLWTDCNIQGINKKNITEYSLETPPPF